MARGRPATTPGTHGEIMYRTTKSGRVTARALLRLYSGQTVDIAATGTSKTAAKRALEARCVERLGTTNEGTLTNTSTLKQLLDAWHEQHDASPRTLTTYRRCMDSTITPAIGALRLNEIATHRLQLFLDGLTESTARTARAVLGGAFSLAVRWGLLDRNPVRETKLKKRVKKEVHALTDQQITTYRSAVKAWCDGEDGQRERGFGLLEIVDVLIGSGMRIGEVLALRWEDVDLDNAVVTIRGTTDEENGRKDFPKTASSRRSIRVAPIAVRALQRQRERLASGVFGEIVFPSIRGTYRTVNNVERQLREARGKLTITPHDFRKTVSTRIEAEHGLLAASRHLGHSSSTVTEQAYLAAPTVVDDYTHAFEVKPAKKSQKTPRKITQHRVK